MVMLTDRLTLDKTRKNADGYVAGECRSL